MIVSSAGVAGLSVLCGAWKETVLLVIESSIEVLVAFEVAVADSVPWVVVIWDGEVFWLTLVGLAPSAILGADGSPGWWLGSSVLREVLLRDEFAERVGSVSLDRPLESAASWSRAGVSVPLTA